MASYWPSCPGYTRGAADERLGKGQYGEAFKEKNIATGEWVAVKYILRKSVRCRVAAPARGMR